MGGPQDVVYPERVGGPPMAYIQRVGEPPTCQYTRRLGGLPHVIYQGRVGGRLFYFDKVKYGNKNSLPNLVYVAKNRLFEHSTSSRLI